MQPIIDNTMPIFKELNFIERERFMNISLKNDDESLRLKKHLKFIEEERLMKILLENNDENEKLKFTAACAAAPGSSTRDSGAEPPQLRRDKINPTLFFLPREFRTTSIQLRTHHETRSTRSI